MIQQLKYNGRFMEQKPMLLLMNGAARQYLLIMTLPGSARVASTPFLLLTLNKQLLDSSGALQTRQRRPQKRGLEENVYGNQNQMGRLSETKKADQNWPGVTLCGWQDRWKPLPSGQISLIMLLLALD